MYKIYNVILSVSSEVVLRSRIWPQIISTVDHSVMGIYKEVEWAQGGSVLGPDLMMCLIC